MNCVIVYASRSGNTKRIAEAIANVLRGEMSVELLEAASAPAEIPSGTDLLVVGAPTEGHGLQEPMSTYLERVAASSVRGVPTAVFDTRLRWPRLLSGSGADRIAASLREKGASLIGERGSFLVTMAPELIGGELERAVAWARSIAALARPAAAAAGS